MENHPQETLHLAIAAAKKARECLLGYLGRLKNIEEKFQAGLVSEADRESEKIIFDHLRKFFPNDEFYGEETSQDNGPKTPNMDSKNGRWIVDPLDGTTNFVHQFPVFCISIGYEIAGELELAVIDVPVLGEVYTAQRGQGAFLNGKKLHVSSTIEIEKSLLATGFFGAHEDALQEQMRLFAQVVRRARGVRRAGAAAYDLAMVARGVFDAFWERNLKPWDSAAGALLVKEAGGCVQTFRGNKYHPYKNTIVAGNHQMVQKLIQEFEPHLSADSD